MGHPIKVNTLKALNSKIALYCKLVDVKAEDIAVMLSGDFYLMDQPKKAKPMYREEIILMVHRNWNVVEYEHYYSDPWRNGDEKMRKIRQIRNCWVQFGEK